MDCTASRERLPLYVDERLEPKEREALDAHVRGCAHCGRTLQSLQRMVASLRALEPPETPPLLPGIHRALEQASWRKTLVQRLIAPWPAGLPWQGLALGTGMTLLLVAVVVPRAFRHGHVASPSLQLASSKGFDQALGRENKAWANRQQSSRSSGKNGVGQTVDGEKRLQDHAGFARAFPEAKAEVAISSTRSRAVDLKGDASTGRDSDVPPVTRSEEQTLAVPYANKLSDAISWLQGAPPPVAARASAAGLAGSAIGPVAQEKQVAHDAAPRLLQIRYPVSDLQAAAERITAWVSARQGFAVPTTERHLAITLPAGQVAPFLQQFPGEVLGAPSTAPLGAPPSLWVRISLELVSSR